LGLLQLVFAVQAGIDPATGQVEHVAAALEILLGKLLGGVGQPEVVVGTGDVGGQGQARALAIHLTGTGAPQGRFPGRALATPQVEAVTAVQRQRAQGAVAAALPAGVIDPGGA